MIRYLKGRGIGGASNSKEADVRLHEAVPDGDLGRPALIFACREQPGHKLRAIQRIYLSDDLSAKASIKVPKRALGAYKGCAIWLGSEAETLVIAEGPEDGLSLREAGCSFVACAITAGNMANLTIPAAVKRVVLFQDNDEAGEKGAKTAAAKYAKQGLKVLIAKPPLPIKDANDLLRGSGVDAVRQTFANVERFVPQNQSPATVQEGPLFFITYAGAEDTELNRAISRKFFIAGIRRIYQPGCKFDTMLVIEGEQGTGKSTLFKLLAMEEEFFSDDFPLGGDTKQTIEQTRGKFLIECAELKGMRASDVTKVKSQLSRTHDYARLAYDRVATEVPRQFLLAGTTNNKKYLKDETGDRRFWPMETAEICLGEITPALVEQLWAEAKVYAEAGEALVIDRSLWKVAAEEQSKRRFENKYVGELEALFGKQMGFLRTVDVIPSLRLKGSSARWIRA